MRAELLVLVTLLTACTGEETDSVIDDTEVTDQDSPHPLVPEEFKNLWNTEGDCSTEFGDGNQMYMIFEGRVDADGSLTGTEQVWWFYRNRPPEDDCVDTFSISGTDIPGSAESLGCVGCEEFYDVRREITENNCRTNYERVYREDDDGLYQRLMFDTLNEFNDQPNENNKVAVFHEQKKWRDEGYETKLYAGEDGSRITPDGAEHGPPASYRWIGRRCQVGWGGS